MHKALAACLIGMLLAACTPAGSSPTTAPTASLAATASPPPASPTPSTSATLASSPTTTVQPSDQPTEPPDSPAGSTWTERSDVAAGPGAREDHTWTVSEDGTIAYLFGGRDGGEAFGELWAFDLTTDSWTLLQPRNDRPAARFGHTATWVPGIGLVVWSGQAGDTFFADIWAYDPAADAWRELPALGEVPPARYGSCASLGPDGRLWVSHGFTEDAGRFADTRAYDFASGEWTDVTPAGDVPVERCLHDCFWSAGRLILYAGQTTGVPALGDIWAYDPAAPAWSKGPNTAAPDRQLYAVTPTGDGVAFVFGGGSLDRGYLDDAWLIHPATLELMPADAPDPRPATRSGATLIDDPTRGRLLLFGGVNGDGALDDLWELSGAP